MERHRAGRVYSVPSKMLLRAWDMAQHTAHSTMGTSTQVLADWLKSEYSE